MGQKIHPIGFRLGINQPHNSKWFSQMSAYSDFLIEDHFLRKTIIKLVPNINPSKIQIQRGFKDSIQLTIYLLKSSSLISHTNALNNLRLSLENKLQKYRQNRAVTFLPFNNKTYCFNSNNPKITIRAIKFSDLDVDVFFIADFLVEQLENRVSFRKAMQKTLRRAQKGKVKGIKICVSGRLNGNEIARSEWIRRGQVPLQTLRAKVAYCFRIASTIYGILGIKVWILKK